MNLLDICELTVNQMTSIFQLADQLRTSNKQLLRGKTFILFFPESSIRTRITFEKGIKALGGECILFPPETLNKKEHLSDVIQYIENWADAVIVRHPDFSKIQALSRDSSIPIVNAMTSTNHPCEILSDLYSISKMRDNYKELVYTFVGPAGNICRSWMDIAKIMDLQFNHVCMSGHELCANSRNYRYYTELEDILIESDVILTDSLPKELINKEYIDKYQITLERMKLTKERAILNPCPPFYRGEEICEDVLSSDYFVGYGFKQNLIHVEQAIILHCLMN
jgi:ornithine carbamoyltransferase